MASVAPGQALGSRWRGASPGSPGTPARPRAAEEPVTAASATLQQCVARGVSIHRGGAKAIAAAFLG